MTTNSKSTKSKSKTPKQLAAQLRRDVLGYVRENMKINRKDQLLDGLAALSEFKKTIKKDAADLRAVADFLEAGDLKRAYNRAERLDTIVRDAISREVWNAMSGGAAFGHTEHDQ